MYISLNKILAYAGTSLPLMLLVTSQKNTSLLQIMNLNMIITEIARALTGSIGLICAIPLTAVITALLLNKK
ncbi:YibE/F family protein [Methylomusa anaerophila]|uniref:YibE/F family protein n=1 Tax=Methylomusa anaerophila TaxID=1930071 RepID=UPI002D1FA302|nr:YibE/F family protein [Methylomusa anaerophila]